MSKIKGKNTKPELIVRKFLHSRGFRFRLHGRELPGKPDIILPKYKKIIMVHGCFWHGHKNCKYYNLPKTRTDWWSSKIDKTRERDIKNEKELRSMGWQVITIYECELKKNAEANLENLVRMILD